MVLDGAMGTQVQPLGLTEEDVRGSRFRAATPKDLRGDIDVLSLTRPGGHRGASTAPTSKRAPISSPPTPSPRIRPPSASTGSRTTSTSSVAQAPRSHGSAVAAHGSGIVAGSLGPTSVTLSLSPRVDDPSYRVATFDEMRHGYARGGAWAARRRRRRAAGRDGVRHAERQGGDRRGQGSRGRARGADPAASSRSPSSTAAAARSPGRRWTPSGSPSSTPSRSPSGSTARWAPPRCGPFLADLARVAPVPVLCYPNAGLPNAFGGYDETPEQTARSLRAFAEDGLVNGVGGCCGTTPEHIARIAAAVHGLAPRPLPARVDAAPLQRARAVRRRRGRHLRRRRRAHERRRLGRLPPARRGRRLAGCARRRARPGARWRQPARREHGRRPARRRSRHDAVPQPRRHRAGGRAPPRDGRQLALGGRGRGSQVPAGEGRRQLDLAQGGGGGLPRQGPRGAPLRRRASS